MTEREENIEFVRKAFLNIQADIAIGKNLEKNLKFLNDMIQALNEDVDKYPDDPYTPAHKQMGYKIYRIRDTLFDELTSK